jgi:hypothetical protein
MFSNYWGFSLIPLGPTELAGTPGGDIFSFMEGASGAEANSEPSALDLRKEDLILANLKARKGEVAEGQKVAEVRAALENDFSIHTKPAEFLLVKQMETEVGLSKKDKSPATTSIFNTVRDFVCKNVDGTGNPK